MTERLQYKNRLKTLLSDFKKFILKVISLNKIDWLDKLIGGKKRRKKNCDLIHVSNREREKNY